MARGSRVRRVPIGLGARVLYHPASAPRLGMPLCPFLALLPVLQLLSAAEACRTIRAGAACALAEG
jgi:hypothetical protein